MKIQLQNTTFYPATGGIENYLYYTAKTLIKKNHEPTILCSQHQPGLPNKEVYDGIDIIRHPYYRLPPIPFTPINPLYYTKKLCTFLKTNNDTYDIIWSRILYEAYASAKVFKGKVPVIFIQAAIASKLTDIAAQNSNLINKAYVKSTYLQNNFIEKRAIEMSDKIVVLSHSKKNEICDSYGLNSNKFEVIPPGVDLRVFKPCKRDETLLNELNLPFKCKIVLTVCRLSNEKNLGMLINAFNKITDTNVYLVIVGDGPQRLDLEVLVKRLGLTKNVRFVGNRRDVERFYSIADVFVLPSTYEGFGQVFLEAMASGVPCIGLRPDYPNIIVACDEIIMDSVTGYLADPYSTDDIFEKIEMIISDDDLKTNLGRKSRSICEEKYTWDKNIDQLLNLSRSILNKW